MTDWVNLDAPGVRKDIARQILADIDAYCVATYDDGHRNHLGASLIGHDCEKYLWGIFRWLKKEKFDGRMQRLFNRGHKEEARFVEWLRGVGFDVWDVQTEVLHYHPESNSYFLAPSFNPGDGLVMDVTGVPEHEAIAKVRGIERSQMRVKACRGHFGGSLDGVNRPPIKYRINEPLLCEFKTQGTGSGFVNLCKNGVAIEKPKHYRQMCIYGKNYGFRNALYMCINKNDDSLHIEIVKLDWALGDSLEAKADSVIRSQYAPAMVSQSEAYVDCKRCVFNGICFKNEMPEKNCRSCEKAIPADDGKWYCETYNNLIPQDFIKVGCNNWKPIV